MINEIGQYLRVTGESDIFWQFPTGIWLSIWPCLSGGDIPFWLKAPTTQLGMAPVKRWSTLPFIGRRAAQFGGDHHNRGAVELFSVSPMDVCEASPFVGWRVSSRTGNGATVSSGPFPNTALLQKVCVWQPHIQSEWSQCFRLQLQLYIFVLAKWFISYLISENKTESDDCFFL